MHVQKYNHGIKSRDKESFQRLADHIERSIQCISVDLDYEIKEQGYGIAPDRDNPIGIAVNVYETDSRKREFLGNITENTPLELTEVWDENNMPYAMYNLQI